MLYVLEFSRETEPITNRMLCVYISLYLSMYIYISVFVPLVYWAATIIDRNKEKMAFFVGKSLTLDSGRSLREAVLHDASEHGPGTVSPGLEPQPCLLASCVTWRKFLYLHVPHLLHGYNDTAFLQGLQWVLSMKYSKLRLGQNSFLLLLPT